MKIDLSGKTAVVTGSTKGIGFAIAKGLARTGASVIVNGRSSAAVTEAVEKLKLDSNNDNVRGVVADLADANGCRSLMAAEPRADILVNNVAFVGWSDFFAAGDDIWQQAWETNVMAAVRLSKHYVGGMEKSAWGRLVFISSESARNVQPDLAPYGATKLALHAVSRAIAKRMSGAGVTSNVVVPGPTLSDGAVSLLSPSAQEKGISVEEAGNEFVRTYRGSSILKRMATSDEVASMVVYLCSKQASATTGASLRVDGGVVEDVN